MAELTLYVYDQEGGDPVFVAKGMTFPIREGEKVTLSSHQGSAPEMTGVVEKVEHVFGITSGELKTHQLHVLLAQLQPTQ